MNLLSRPLIRMPEFSQGEWLNSETQITRASLRGQVVLIDFWDYACINCVRTFPYVTEWYKRYKDVGFEIIGIHTPEFKFAQQRAQVEAAVAEFELQHPILLDNAYKNWDAFANKAWPTKYLIDMNGYIRYEQRGEGAYKDTEQAIQQLLLARDPELDLPNLLPPLRAEDRSGAVCYRPTPELHAGYHSGLFGGALGNPEGYHPSGPMVYELPRAQERQVGQFFVDGIWQARPESLSFVGQEQGRIVLPYEAAGVNVVLSPTGDEVELMLGLRPTQAEPIVEVLLDGRSIPASEAGADILYDQNNRSLVYIKRPRMVELVSHADFESHELELIFKATGLSLFTFTFTTCIAPPHAKDTTRIG